MNKGFAQIGIVAVLGVMLLGSIGYNIYSGPTLGLNKFKPVQFASSDSPSDEECYTYEATGATGEWQTCGSGGSGDAFAWTAETWGNSTTTTLGFTQGILVTGSSTAQELKITNGTTTNATSTSLSLSGLFHFDSQYFDSLTDDATLSNNSGDLRVVDVNCTDCLSDTEIDSTIAISSRNLTVAGTANQITSSAGAQDLSADRTWTLSLPNHVIFPSSFEVDSSTTTNATTTNLDITNLLTFNGVTGDGWTDFCTTITGGAGLCDGDDATGGAGLWTDGGNFIYPATVSDTVLVGTSTLTTLDVSLVGVATSTDTDYLLVLYDDDGDRVFEIQDTGPNAHYLNGGGADDWASTPSLAFSNIFDSQLQVTRANNIDIAGPALVGYRARGSASSLAVPQAGDELMQFAGRGYDGSWDTQSAGAVTIYAAETWSGSAHGSYIAFETTANGATSETERLRIGNDGSINIGTAGVALSQDGDGALTFLGLGNGNDEDLTFNFDDVANIVDITSSTGVTGVDFNTLDVITDDLVLGGESLTSWGGNGVQFNSGTLDFDCSDVTDSGNDGISCSTDDLVVGAGSYLTADATNLDLDVEIYRDSKSVILSATSSSAGISTTTELSYWQWFTPNALTITDMRCNASLKTGTSTIRATHNTDSLATGGTDILFTTGATCGSDEALATTTFSDATVPADSFINVWVSDAEPTGARPGAVRTHFEFTVDD